MTIENLVPSFETCKKAKELGFPQDTQFWYDTNKNLYHFEDIYNAENNLFCGAIAAPTLHETLDKLPAIVEDEDKGDCCLYVGKLLNAPQCCVSYTPRDMFATDLYNIANLNPAQAALQLWIKLKKEGVI